MRVCRGTNSPHCLAWPTCKFKIGNVYSKDLGKHLILYEGVNGVPLKSVISKILAKKSVMAKIGNH